MRQVARDVGQRPAVEAAAGRGVLWGQWRQASAFAGCDSKVSEQVWELYGNVYCGSWLIICPARSPGELLGGSGELSEAVPDH